MPIFKIKETEKVMMAYIYEVEAETKEEALALYIDELAGTLQPVHEYDDESTSVEDITLLEE